MTNFPKPDEINAVLEIPAHDSSTPVKPSEAKFIYDFLREKGITNTLEIGFAYGRSASHIVAATHSKHIVIDPFQINYGSNGLKNISKLGMAELLEHRPDFSHNVLPQLAKEGAKFDFIFIDGDHKFDGIFVDFYYSDFLVNQGGYLLFHDTWMRSTQLVLSFIKNNRADYELVPTPLRNLALYRKKGADTRDGMHFKGFYTFKSLLLHPFIIWISSGEETFLKKLLLKVKAMVK